jgi:hypothetical protein
LINNKIKNFLNSFRGKVIIAIALIATASILYITKVFLIKDDSSDTDTGLSEIIGGTDKQAPPNLETLQKTMDANIDSVLSTFGIKKEWITTLYNTSTEKPGAKNNTKEAEWFTKSVLIPKDLSSIEVNLDLSGFINGTGLVTSTNEDIITKDIILTVTNPDTGRSKLPLAKISVVHSDKVIRESAVFCFIINGIGDYSPEEIDKLVMNKSEFSFVFPRNLDEIDIQNKLLQHKKDILINLTVGGKDNYNTDFNTSLDEKAIRERVKSFSTDYSSVSTVILTRSEADVQQSAVNRVADEFAKFNIKVINDSSLTKLLTTAEEDSKDKTGILFTNLKTKAGLVKNIVTLVKITPDEFEKFYNDVLILKKLGYKFCTYSEYFVKAAEMDKLQKEKEEKLRLEEEKRLADKKSADKKAADKKAADKKKIEKKKQPEKKTDKKKTDTKKPETKKQIDVKKKK